MDLPLFTKLARDWTRIPVVREIRKNLDIETPVSAFWKLRSGPWSFLLESVEGGERWARYTCMGTEPRAIYEARGKTVTVRRPGANPETVETDDALGWITQRVRPEETYSPENLPRLFAGLVGVITYDAVREMERIPEENPTDDTLPDLCFLETRLTLVWDNLTHGAQLVYFAHTPVGSDPAQIFQEAMDALDEAQARLEAPLPPLPQVQPQYLSLDELERSLEEGAGTATNVDDMAFAQMVERAREIIADGDVIQVVLSRRFSQPRNGCHPFAVYRALRHLNPSPYMFYLELEETTLVGASPEVLVRLSGDILETRPIAGTRPRGQTPEEDEALARELLADPKERAEHLMLVDLGRNDIGRIAETGSVEVAEWMVVERYSHVMHLVSHVRGRKREDVGIPEVIRAVFPAGTLSGAPKVRAMEIIEEMEGCRRGAYGGAVGFIGATGDVDMCIAIRMLVATPDELWVQAGAGIVYDSDPISEAHETRHKATAVLSAIAEARELYVVEAP